MFPTTPDEPCPDYDSVMGRGGGHRRSNTTSSGSTDASYHSGRSQVLDRQHSFRDHQRETSLHAYRLSLNGIPVHFRIIVEPLSPGSDPGQCTFHLSVVINNVERVLCEPVTMNVRVHPSQIEFVIFTFPGKASTPVSCLHSFRVWLRCNGVDHRLFAGEDLWLGQDPTFSSIEDASFARLKNVGSDYQVYQSIVGGATVLFTVRWEQLPDFNYQYSLDYEAGGIGEILYTWKLRTSHDPRLLAFLIYSVPMQTKPSNSCHRLRLWAHSAAPFPKPTSPASATPLPFGESHIYQRLWKSDTFQVGSRLSFDSLNSRAQRAFAVEPPRLITTTTSAIDSPKSLHASRGRRALPTIPAGTSHYEEDHGGEFM